MRIPDATPQDRGARVVPAIIGSRLMFEMDFARTRKPAWEDYMPDSVYKVIELVGTSTKSWEDAAKTAVDRAAKSLRDLRVAEVVQLDMVLDNGKVEAYRAKINVSFKYEGGG
jgi:flavin-binding protein dodecin